MKPWNEFAKLKSLSQEFIDKRHITVLIIYSKYIFLGPFIRLGFGIDFTMGMHFSPHFALAPFSMILA